MTLDIRHVYRGDAVPADLGAGEILIVMGGPMGVSDAGDARFPYLAPELALLEKLVARDRPVLGICLGSQLLARAAGARVYPAARREVGWAPVRFIGVEREPVLRGLRPRRRCCTGTATPSICPTARSTWRRRRSARTRRFGCASTCSACSFTASCAARRSRPGCATTPTTSPAPTAPAGGERILADTDRYMAERSARGRPPASQHLGNFRRSRLTADSRRLTSAAFRGAAACNSRFGDNSKRRMSTSANQIFTLGLVQMRCSDNPAENVEKAIAARA